MEKMEYNYIIEIKFLSFREMPQVNKIKFNGNIYEVSKDMVKKINIPSKFFEEDESKNSSIKLFKDSVLVNECILEIFKGANYFYCFIDEKGYTFQLLFLNNHPKIRIPIFQDKYYNITEFDTNKTLTRKRFTFINANFHSILIDENYFIIPSFIPALKSYQISVYDVKQNLAVTKPLLLDKESNFSQYFDKYYSLSIAFLGNIEDIIKRKKKIKGIKNYLSKFQSLNLEFFSNKSKSKLINIFNNELHIKFYASISLYKVMYKFQENEFLNEIIEYFFQKINEIKENKSLAIYQKILLIECFIGLCFDCDSKEEIENANFLYYLMAEKEKNSVLDLIENFFLEYRNKLTEKSPVFTKLIELDGDSGIYQNESFYCFNMQNLDEIKKHLKEIETNIFVIHDLNNKNCANTDIVSGIVSVNVHNINHYKLLDFPLDKELPEEKKEIGEIVASKIVYYLLHEINGHKKFSYKKNKYPKSPTKFIENGEIYSLCPKNSYLKGEKIIKIVPDDQIGEDGYFYELCYGKILDYYTFEIMDNIDDFSELLSEVDLWVNRLDKLREYIKYKYALQKYESSFKSTKLIIDEKISDYKNECLKLQNIKHVNMDNFFMKKSDKKNNKKQIKTISKLKFKKINQKKEKFDAENDSSSKEVKFPNDNEFKSSPKNEEEKAIVKKGEHKSEIKLNRQEEVEKEKEEEEEGEEGDEEGEGEEEEEKEEEENEDKINEQFGKLKFMELPYELLLIFEKSGILTKKQTYLLRKRRRSLLRSVRYNAILDNDI